MRVDLILTDVKKAVLLVVGWTLIVLAPLASPLPGPGGIFLFAGGFAILLRTSPWVRRRFVAAERRWPRLGAMVNRILRRPSALRRRARGAEAGADPP